jgi:hypothetical protein
MKISYFLKMINITIFKASDETIFYDYFQKDEKFNQNNESQSTYVFTIDSLDNFDERIFLQYFLYDFNINFSNKQYFEIMFTKQYFYLAKSKLDNFMSLLKLVDDFIINLNYVDLDMLYNQSN